MLVMSFALIGTSIAQQKYGHANFGSLVSAMPQTKEADTDLEAYQGQLVAKGEEMAKAFQAKVAKYYEDQKSGDVPPKDLAAREQALQKEQQGIVAYEQEMSQKMGVKRDELLSPLVKQVQDAIAKVAKANGYDMIFDTSRFNAILFADDVVDITELVKAELGIE